MNECFSVNCNNKTTVEFCAECLANGGFKPMDYISSRLENNFKYHSPKEGQPEKYTAIREKAKELAHMIDELCPDGREKELAHTNIEQASMWANAAIARS